MHKSIYNEKHVKPVRRKLRVNGTIAERVLWSRLRNKQLGYKFRRQYSVNSYILDFYCSDKRLAIEVDGGQHNDEKNVVKDLERTKYLESLDIKMIRFWNNDVLLKIDAVVEQILISLTS